MLEVRDIVALAARPNVSAPTVHEQTLKNLSYDNGQHPRHSAAWRRRAFISLSPQLGGTPTEADEQTYAKSGHYQDGEFVNLIPTRQLTGGSTLAVMWNFLFHKDAPGHARPALCPCSRSTRWPSPAKRPTWCA